MAELFTMGSIAAFLTLAALEIVLGVDNLVFISIVSNKLPPAEQDRARKVGLGLAAIGRIVLLFAIAWVMMLDKTVLFEMFGNAFTVKDLVLFVGGGFLLFNGTREIHHAMDRAQHGPQEANQPKAAATFGSAIAQILAMDLVFSIDSVLTAIGMVKPDGYTSGPFPGTTIPWPPLVIMVTAILAAVGVMLFLAGPVSRFIDRNPTFKMLALAFLLLIGVVLVAESMDQHIERGYIYAAMGFSLFVEVLNLKVMQAKQRKENRE